MAPTYPASPQFASTLVCTILLLMSARLGACRLPQSGPRQPPAGSVASVIEPAAILPPPRGTETRAKPSATRYPLARPTATASPALTLTLVASGFEQPLLVLEPRDGSGRRFVVEKAGVIKTSAVGGPAAPWRTWLDLRERVGSEASEQGLLGLALHPRFAANGRFYVNYTDNEGDTVISEFQARPGAMAPLADSERVLMRIPQPAGNHNGGHLAFGPDGYLYIASGDGGGGGSERAQALDNRLGKILRIDVDRRSAGLAYGIPPDNPWAAVPGPAAETWSLGLRNPWRFSFDAATGDLYIGDVGASSWEEINREPWTETGGRNYGWPRYEGREARDEDVALARQATRASPPILVYPHDAGSCAVTGGLVYHGQALPWLRGAYVFADYCSGRLWAAMPSEDERGTWWPQPILDSGLSVSHIGEDEDSELLLLDLTSGGVHRLIPSPSRPRTGAGTAGSATDQPSTATSAASR